MATSVRVYIESISSLRDGKRHFRNMMKTHGSAPKTNLPEQPVDLEAGMSSSNLGMVVIEVKVGAVKKRTTAFRISGEVTVPVKESMLMPTPYRREADPEGEELVIRILQVGHLMPDKLVAEATLPLQLDTAADIPVLRKGIEVGFVRYTLTEVREAFMPVSHESSQSHNLGRMAMKLRNRVVDNMLVRSGPSGQSWGISSRRPLLPVDDAEDSVAECKVIIDSVEGLAAKFGKPYFMVSVEGQSFRASRFSHATQGDLTYTFSVKSFRSSIQIYCYDDVSVERSTAVGRILLPLSDLFWDAGRAPTVGALCATLRRKSQLQRSYKAHFMPMGKAGSAAKAQADVFQAALKVGAGLKKANVFGLVQLRVELTLGPSSKGQLLETARRIVSKAARRGEGPVMGPSVSGKTEDSDAEPSLWSVIRNVDVNGVMANINRLETLAFTAPRGIVRWLRVSQRRGIVCGFLWLAFCVLGFFPPPVWLCLVYFWVFLLINGLLAARQRAEDWSDVRKPVFNVWKEDNVRSVAPGTGPSIKEALSAFKQVIQDLERSTRTAVSFLERVAGLLTFADGPSSLLFYLGFGLAAVNSSIAFFLWSYIDPHGSYALGFAGLGICLLLSGALSKHHKAERRPMTRDDLLRPLELALWPLAKFNDLFDQSPDSAELAHRFISTRIQCQGISALLNIQIVSARDLHNADWMRGDKSDPYCICQIRGKPRSRFQTAVVKNCLDPTWNFETTLQYDVGDLLVFTVMDKDFGKADDTLGTATLPSLQIFPSGFDGELELQLYGKKQGFLRVIVTVVSDSEEED
mmetsp:Transcript_59570/g.128927  ORF Transcript_59570/g.128927 Transcript_59570/m.128927 type:complete len:805 (+) Transcript_59570:55-2469(+)